MTGYAGQKGTAELAERYRRKLLDLFPRSLVDEAKKMARDCRPPEACLPVARVKISSGGVAGALRILGEKLQSGLRVDLRAVPIRQETVEICEALDLDPYELGGEGAWLIAVKDTAEALFLCRRGGIPAARIGETAPGAARILICGETVRYLE